MKTQEEAVRVHFEWQQYRSDGGRAQTKKVTIPRLEKTGYPKFLLEKKKAEKREEAKKKQAEAKKATTEQKKKK